MSSRKGLCVSVLFVGQCSELCGVLHGFMPIGVHAVLQVMPQFNPLWWINLVSWTFAILAFTTWYHQTISFPYTIRVQLTRAFISFSFSF
jgi:hypothetical protein